MRDGEKGAVMQRDGETYGIAPHSPCGVVTPDLLRRIADVAEKYQVPMLKITSAARIAMLGVQEADIDGIWADLGMDPGYVIGLCVRSVKACPGTQFCKRGRQDSLALGIRLDKSYHGMELPGKLKIGVSGCAKQCAETSFKDIGLVGDDSGWKIFVGGCGGKEPHLGELLAADVSTDQAVELVAKIVDYYREYALPRERIWRVMERYGLRHMQDIVNPAVMNDRIGRT